jgi:hypothetical protein
VRAVDPLQRAQDLERRHLDGRRHRLAVERHAVHRRDVEQVAVVLGESLETRGRELAEAVGDAGLAPVRTGLEADVGALHRPVLLEVAQHLEREERRPARDRKDPLGHGGVDPGAAGLPPQEIVERLARKRLEPHVRQLRVPGELVQDRLRRRLVRPAADREQHALDP